MRPRATAVRTVGLLVVGIAAMSWWGQMPPAAASRAPAVIRVMTAAAEADVTETFSYTGKPQDVKIPGGFDAMEIRVAGGDGGTAYGVGNSDAYPLGAGAQVAGHDTQLLYRMSDEFGGPTTGIGMAQAVKPVAVDAVALPPFSRNGVRGGRCGHRRMEGGIETTDGRNIREQVTYQINSGQRFRLVQRSQVGELNELLLNGGVDEYGRRELRASVHDAMADRIDLSCDARDRRSDWDWIKLTLVGPIIGEQDRVVRSEKTDLQAG